MKKNFTTAAVGRRPMITTRRLLGTLATFAVTMGALAGTATASTLVGKQTASGSYAIAMASGTSNHPGHLQLVLSSTPRQSATVSWELVCTEKSGGVGSSSGQRTLILPAVKLLKPPAPSSSCIVSADAQLSATGTVTVAIRD